METAIYIPSHKRPDFAFDLAKRCNNVLQELPCYVVVDASQAAEYKKFFSEQAVDIDAEILKIKDEGRQMGYARNFCCCHADKNGFTHHFQFDDDVQIPENTKDLLNAFNEYPKLFSSAGYMGLYGLYIGVKPNTGYHLSYNRGMMTWVLDTEKVIEVGNFDKKLVIHEDDELLVRALMGGYYMGIDSGVKCGIRNKHGASGGCSTWGYTENEYRMKEYLEHKHGKFFGMRNKRTFIQWMKMRKAGKFPEIDFSKMTQYQK